MINFFSDKGGATVVLSDLWGHSKPHSSSVNFKELQIIKEDSKECSLSTGNPDEAHEWGGSSQRKNKGMLRMSGLHRLLEQMFLLLPIFLPLFSSPAFSHSHFKLIHSFSHKTIWKYLSREGGVSIILEPKPGVVGGCSEGRPRTLWISLDQHYLAIKTLE